MYIDFTKCFDMIPRDLLISKIVRLHKIRGKLLRVIYELLRYNAIRVFDGVSHSEDVLQTRGVQQGDSLSPLLFLLFVSDLPRILKDVGWDLQVCCFADDVIFYSVHAHDIQYALDQLS